MSTILFEATALMKNQPTEDDVDAIEGLYGKVALIRCALKKNLSNQIGRAHV